MSKHFTPLIYSEFDEFLKADKSNTDDAHYRKFRRQLVHTSLSKILESLKPGMTEPELARCPDGHYRRIVYGIGPYIADYPEQALLACIVQGWCPKLVVPLMIQLPMA